MGRLLSKVASTSPEIKPSINPKAVDWAYITQKQLIEGDKGLADRLAIWSLHNEALGRVVTSRPDLLTSAVIYEAFEPS